MDIRSLEKQASEMEKVRNYWDGVTKDMGNSFSSNFLNFVHSGFSDLAGFVKGFGEDVLSMFEKMAMNALMFGNIMAQAKPGGGYGGVIGWLGSLLSLKEGGIMNASFHPIQAYAGGGVASSPTLGMFGEGGPEAFVPLRNGKIPVEGGRGQMIDNSKNYYININAIDTQSFAEVCRKNPAGFLAALKDYKRSAGSNNGLI